MLCRTALRCMLGFGALQAEESSARPALDCCLCTTSAAPRLHASTAPVDITGPPLPLHHPRSVIAETGVQFISCGALTHSVPALDISLNIETQQ